MWILPMALRAKMASVVLLGIFFIPFATSDLRGLSHVLTCEDEVSASLFIDNEAEETVLLSADAVTREDAGMGLCGGLRVDLQVASARGDRADVVVAITNTTEHRWQGSVELQFGDTRVPVAIGSIDRGGTATDHVELHVREGADYEVTGKLLIGP